MANPDGGDTLDQVILCGIDVSKKLHAKHSSFPKDISDLATMAESAMDEVAKAVGDARKFKLQFHPRTYQAESVLGKIENFNDEKADIVYDVRQRVCWRRFIITKEICHVLYHPNTYSHLTSTPEDVEQLLNKLMAGVDIGSSDHAYSCDSSTMLMALEILLPHHQRAAVNGMIKNEKTTLDIALFYRLPERWVRIYLSPDYIAIMERCYALAG